MREFGRAPISLIYLTSRTVKIRDGNYIALHINDDTGTRAAFDERSKVPIPIAGC